MQSVSEEAGEHGCSTVKAWCLGSRWSEGGLALSLSPRQIHPTPGSLRVTEGVVDVMVSGMTESLTSATLQWMKMPVTEMNCKDLMCFP